MASDCLQKKRLRSPKSAPGGLKSELQGSQNRLLEASGASWAADGRQMAAKTALEALLGSSWGGLGGSWASLGASLIRLDLVRRAPGGSGEGPRDARAPTEAEKATQNLLTQRFLNVFLVRSLASIFALFLLARSRPAAQAAGPHLERAVMFLFC